MARDRKRKLPVVPGHHPLMMFLDEQLQAQEVSAAQAAVKAGMSINIVSQWRRGITPSIGNFDAVLNVLGYKLAVVRLTPERSEGVEAVVPL